MANPLTSVDFGPNNHRLFQYSEFGTRTETSDQEITEGALPDSEVSDSEGPDLNFGTRNEMTEDFSLRSEDQTSKYADFIENV